MARKKESRIDLELKKFDKKIAAYEKSLEENNVWLKSHIYESDTKEYKERLCMLTVYQELIKTCHETKASLINAETATKKDSLLNVVVGEAARGLTRGAIDLVFLGSAQAISDGGSLPIFSQSDSVKDFMKRR